MTPNHLIALCAMLQGAASLWYLFGEQNIATGLFWGGIAVANVAAIHMT